MHSFRLRLILALIASVTLVSVASTYFEVLSHKHTHRQELALRSQQSGASVQPDLERLLAAGNLAALPASAENSRVRIGALSLVVFDAQGQLLASSGPVSLVASINRAPVARSLRKGTDETAFGRTADQQWLEEAIPLHDGSRLLGTMAILADAGDIHREGIALWRGSFWRIGAFVILIVAVTVLMVRWFLMGPLTRAAERLRRLRTGNVETDAERGRTELSLFTPLAREMESMAESLMAARASAAAEARLRDAGERLWTAERLAAFIHCRSGSSRIFVVSNREPYAHERRGREIVCIVPPSGLVTAIEPVLRACDGVWVACGSGNADAEMVDDFDRLRVPPDDPRYTLRRVWLSEEEETRYYDGFANEGLWPLCHIAHTRPIFRAADWECYQRVNERFAQALLEEMEGAEDPVVFVQDYHFALLPQLIKAARPDARVAIFWHIPWPNPEAFGICPWQAELIDGLLGADLIGFHIPLHCNNFLSTVDRVIESRTDREHMTVRRHGHFSAVRPYPVSVAFEGAPQQRAALASVDSEQRATALARQQLLAEFGVRAETLALGVDRLDYTKGIIERLLAIEQLLEDHPWHRERLTMVQIAAPSRTRIPSYSELGHRLHEAVNRINLRYQTAHWRPIVLIERHCDHDTVNRWYRAADICLVTSLHDGMNLVAKEFVAARDDEDGVLVLSKFTGAAIELQDALLVNPYDIVGVAEAIHAGLEMNRDDRCQRMRRMRHHIMEHNIYGWGAAVLGDLRELRIEATESTDVHHPGPISVPAPAVVHRKLA
jgi:trehalose 6-phosphate synthase